MVMPRGGSRPNSGPAPDPKSLRQMKLAEKGGFKLLPREWTETPPEWPLMYRADRELELWERFWKKPQARIWAAQGSEIELAIHIRTLVEAETPNVPINRRSLLLQQQNSLLLTEATLSKAGYKIADEEEVLGNPATATRTARPASSRTRLRAVPNVGPTKP